MDAFLKSERERMKEMKRDEERCIFSYEQIKVHQYEDLLKHRFVLNENTSSVIQRHSKLTLDYEVVLNVRFKQFKSKSQLKLFQNFSKFILDN